MWAAQWEVAVERPTYDLTVFRLHCGKLALKIYSKGERVLRIEAVAHNIREFNCGRLLDNFPEIVRRLKGMLERFMEALSCIDQCFIGDEMLERLPLPSRVGKSMVGGSISTSLACVTLPRPSSLFCLSRRLHRLRTGRSGSRARQSKPLRLRSPPCSLRSEKTPRQTDRPPDRLDASLRAPSVRSAGDHCLLVLRDKAIKPLLAAAQEITPTHGGQKPCAIDRHYQDLRLAMQAVFHELGIAA